MNIKSFYIIIIFFLSSLFLSLFSLHIPFNPNFFASSFHLLIFFFSFSFSFLFHFISLSSSSSSLHLAQLCDFVDCFGYLVTHVCLFVRIVTIYYLFSYIYFISLYMLISCGEDSRYAVMHLVLTFCGVQCAAIKYSKLKIDRYFPNLPIYRLSI